MHAGITAFDRTIVHDSDRRVTLKCTPEKPSSSTSTSSTLFFLRGLLLVSFMSKGRAL